MKYISKNHRIVFFACWIILGLIQARFTQLQEDEAYYWVYAHYPAWGYFDHPPMIAMLVRAGYAIFHNELGVRLFPLLLNTLSLLIIEKLIDKKNSFLFYGIVLSMAVLQLTSFIAAPDIPLIFFTALFFYCYKKLLLRPSVTNSMLLGLAIALLLYSKYQAVLVVIFTLASNLKLFTRYNIYLAGALALLLFAPHLYWQYQHDWISFRYHLFESNVNPYKISFTFNYFIGQILLVGPLAGFILLPAAFLYVTKDKLEKALRYTLIGVYAFFLLSSFRGKVEANWTSPILAPLIILSHHFLADKLSWQKWLYRLLPLTMALVLFARVAMLVDILPLKEVQSRYHAWKNWPVLMKEKTKGLPIVFSNSYQRASLYWFYSAQETYSLNSYRNRKNNYNFWPIEDSLLGKPVYFLDIYGMSRFPDSLKTPIGWVGYRYDSFFYSFSKIKIIPEKFSLRLARGETATLNCRVEIPGLYADFIRLHSIVKDTTRIGVFDKNGWIKDLPIPFTLSQSLKDNTINFSIDPGLAPGNYYLIFCIKQWDYPATHNSERISLLVK